MVRRRAPYNPSDDLFTSRVQDLIRTRGSAYVQRLTNRSADTVRRWGRGGQASSFAIRRSVTRAGLRTVGDETRTPSAPVVQSRVRGRFSTEGQIITSGIARRFRSETSRAQAQRAASLESARTGRQREMAEDLTVDEIAGTQQEWSNLDAQYQALQSRDLDAINEAFGTEYDYEDYWWELDWYIDLWEDWRSNYEAQSG